MKKILLWAVIFTLFSISVYAQSCGDVYTGLHVNLTQNYTCDAYIGISSAFGLQNSILDCQGNTITLNGSTTYAVYLEGNTSAIKNCNINYLGTTVAPAIGMIDTTNNAIIQNNTITYNLITTSRGAISIDVDSGGDNITIRDNTIFMNNTITGYGIAPTTGSLATNIIDTLQIINNTIIPLTTTAMIPIRLNAPSANYAFNNTLIQGNNLGHTSSGIAIVPRTYDSYNITIRDNLVWHTGSLTTGITGIFFALQSTQSILDSLIYNNTISQNTTSTSIIGFYGIYLNNQNTGDIVSSGINVSSNNIYQSTTITGTCGNMYLQSTTNARSLYNISVENNEMYCKGNASVLNFLVNQNVSNSTFINNYGYTEGSTGIVAGTYMTGSASLVGPRGNYFFNNTFHTVRSGTQGGGIHITTNTNPATSNIFNMTKITSNQFWVSLNGNLNNSFVNTIFNDTNSSIRINSQMNLESVNVSRSMVNLSYRNIFIYPENIKSYISNLTGVITFTNLSSLSVNPIVNPDGTGWIDCNATNYCPSGHTYSQGILAYDISNIGEPGIISTYNFSFNESSCDFELSGALILSGNATCNDVFISNAQSGAQLDCNGNTVIFNTGGGVASAINLNNTDNIQIANCTFIDSSSSGQNSIFTITNVNDSSFFYNILLMNRTTTKGFDVFNGNNINIYENQIISYSTGQNNTGIFMNQTYDSYPTDNNITFLGGSRNRGIDTIGFERGSVERNIINVSVKGDNNIGIYLRDGTKNITSLNNEIYINGSQDGRGFYLEDVRGFEGMEENIINFSNINGSNNIGVYFKNLTNMESSAKVSYVENRIIMEANDDTNFGLVIEEYYPGGAQAFDLEETNITITGSGTNNTGWLIFNSHDISSDVLNIIISTDDSYGFVSHNANNTFLGTTRASVGVQSSGDNTIGVYSKGDTNTLEIGSSFLINMSGDGNLFGIKDESQVESLVTMNFGTILIDGGNGTGILINSSASNGFTLEDSQIEITNADEALGVGVYNDSAGILLDSNNLILEASSDAFGLDLKNVQGGSITSTYIQMDGDVHSQMIELDNGAELNVFVDTVLNGSENYLTSLNLPTNNTFDNTKFATNSGSIRVKPSVDFGPSKAISRNDIIISQNGAFMNSSKLTEFNQSSEIILENISVIAPKIVVDLTDNGTFVDCNTPTCNITSYSANVMTFNVSHFTNYSVQSNATTPTITIASPQGTTYYTNIILVDISASDPTLQNIWFNWNGTNVIYTTPINVTFANGTNTLTAYANNSFGVVASLDVTFIVETYPLMINQSTVLSQNHSNNDTLIIITGDNLSLDCAGYWLIGSGNGIGIELDGRFNVTIENCNINGFSRNIYSVQTNNSLYQNINSTNSTIESIVWNMSRENTFENSRIFMTQDGADAFSIIESNDNILQNLIINGSDEDAISLETSHTSVMNNITVISNHIRLGSSNDTRISNIDIQNGDLVFSLGSDSNTMENISISGRLIIGFSVENDFYNTTINSTTRAIDFNAAQDNRMNLTYISSSDEWMRTITGAINNLTNTYYLTDEGYIRYPQLIVTAGDALEFNTLNMNVTSNNAYLNSTVLDWLNTSAIIQLNNVPNAISKPVVDFEDDGTFVDCISPNCTILLQNQATFIFNVTHFTSYSTESNGSNITNATGAVLSFNIPTGGSQFVYSLGFETNNTPNRTTAYSTISGTTNTSVGVIPPPNILMDVDVNSWNYFDTLVKNTFGLTILPDLYNRTFGIYFLLNTSGTDGNKVELTFNLTELSEAYYSGFMSDNVINQDSFILTAGGYAGGTIPFNSSQDNIPIAITFT